ncbi:MAG: hypothetical protein RR900_01525, partial [Ruthenibacterium sp.]
MTSYERVKMALNHQEPDRVPFDLGASGVTTINVNALKELRSYFGLNNDNVKVTDIINQTATVDDDLIEVMKIDVKPVDPLPPQTPGLSKPVWQEGTNHLIQDEFGIIWRMPPNGHYFDLHQHPLAQAEEPEEIDAYPWPKGNDPSRFIGMQDKVKHIVHEEKKAFMLGRMSAGMWENAMWMTGYEKFFCDMIVNEPLVHRIMEHFTQLKMDYWEKALEAAGKDVLVCS